MNVVVLERGINKLNINGHKKDRTRKFMNRTLQDDKSETEKKASKTRRKFRLRKDKSNQNIKEQRNHLHFDIQRLQNQICSIFIKIRSDKCKNVNIYSFLSDSRKSIIFQNSLCNQFYLKGSNDNFFTCNAKTLQNGMSKQQRRKYFRFDLQYQNSSPRRLTRLKMKKQKKNQLFTPFLTEDDFNIKEIRDELIEGVIRINGKNFKEAYVSNPEAGQEDYLIDSIRDRNRALEGDIVYLKPKPKEEWKEKLITACVVFIKEKVSKDFANSIKFVYNFLQVHNRKAVGFLSMGNDGKQPPILVPRDIRLPRIKIPKRSIPSICGKKKNFSEKTLFLAQIVDWKEVRYAEGVILEELGEETDMNTENKALLFEHNIDVTDVPIFALQDMVNMDAIPLNEIDDREDLRKECVFTIDPLTAKDLDDALSLKELPNGNYEIGVHIADVTYYLPEDTDLDKIVRQKATSVYLVDKVYHMLPTSLCLNCSLLPNKDSLTFSVFWEFTENGDVMSHRFGRTVIRSCAQLAYEHAQMMIENPEKAYEKNEIPSITNGYDVAKLSGVVNIFQKIALKLRSKRYANGALRIDQPKLSFALSPVDKSPVSFSICEMKEANRLIEEFMLLANETVAREILRNSPEISFLRNHVPPLTRILNDVRKMVANYGIELAVETGAAIQESLRKIDPKSEKGKYRDGSCCRDNGRITNEFSGVAQLAVLNHLITKAMQRATYVCSGECQSYRHYALSMDIYTHFTSPIRRYADIMVHRLLAGSLGRFTLSVSIRTVVAKTVFRV